MPKKSQKNKRTPKRVVKLGEPVFLYFSVCHNAKATKEPLQMPAGNRVGAFGAAPEAEGSLGGWRCSQCNKPCKCTRTRNTPKTEEVASVA